VTNLGYGSEGKDNITHAKTCDTAEKGSRKRGARSPKLVSAQISRQHVAKRWTELRRTKWIKPSERRLP